MAKIDLRYFILMTVGVANYVTPAFAAPFFFPNLGNSPAQESITTQDGTTCTQNVNSRTSLNLGLYGNSDSGTSNNIYSAPEGSDVGAFVMVNVPLNSSPRLDCAKLLEIEIERAKLRLQEERTNTEEPREQDTVNPMYKKTFDK